ncbi:ArsR family transcriptional regulator [Anaerotaenia torta]|uniref:ArsR/SmtB family transcription factor n=1 Tax=Anaerotaenia torta TaxID=433293 RepID=UPI003D2340CB
MNNNFHKYNETAELLKTIAHPVRLCIIKGLLEKGECNVTYMQSCLGTPQSTVSQHIQKLKAAGIIEGRRSGLEIFYKVKNNKVAELIRLLFYEESNTAQL